MVIVYYLAEQTYHRKHYVDSANIGKIIQLRNS